MIGSGSRIKVGSARATGMCARVNVCANLGNYVLFGAEVRSMRARLWQVRAFAEGSGGPGILVGLLRFFGR